MSHSGGTGAGGGIKPLGAIIFDAQGARVEGVKGAATSIAKVLGEAAGHTLEGRARSGGPDGSGPSGSGAGGSGGD